MTIVAIPNPLFQPAMREITNISQNERALVTTSFPHLYVTGTIVRLYVPSSYGMFQANHLTSEITVISDSIFLVNIDTRYFDPFITPGDVHRQYAQVVPIGENNNMLTAAEHNILG